MNTKMKKRSAKYLRKATKLLQDHLDKDPMKLALSIESRLLLNGCVIIEHTFDREGKLMSTEVSSADSERWNP